MITREKAIELARQQAAQDPDVHGYTQGASTDPNWQPHAWVIAAIQLASVVQPEDSDAFEAAMKVKDTVTLEAAEPVTALGMWFTLRARIASECKPLVEQESEWRKRLFAYFFPAPKEGTNSYTLPDGHVLKGTYPVDRKVDAQTVLALRGLRVGDLEAALAASLGLAQVPPETVVAEAMRLNVDSLLSWEPKLQTKPYRELTAEQRAIFDRCLTIKPGSLSMEVAAPKAPKATAQPAGFGPAGPENLP